MAIILNPNFNAIASRALIGLKTNMNLIFLFHNVVLTTGVPTLDWWSVAGSGRARFRGIAGRCLVGSAFPS